MTTLQAFHVIVLVNVMVGTDEETAGACGGINHGVVEPGLHQLHHGADLQQAFIHVPKAFGFGAVPIQFLYFHNEFVQGGGYADYGTGVVVDGLGNAGTVGNRGGGGGNQFILTVILHP